MSNDHRQNPKKAHGNSSLQILMLCLTDDPLDAPGSGRVGGGHLFVFDLGRFLVRQGHQVTYIVRLNSRNKPEFEKIGPNCNLHRIPVGPKEDIPTYRLATLLDELSHAAAGIVERSNNSFNIVHSHNWSSGEVARRLPKINSTFHVHSLLSLGRARIALGEERTSQDDLRDKCEVRVFSEANQLIAVCPGELDDLVNLYSDVENPNISLIPYGVNSHVFYSRPQYADDNIRGKISRSTQRPDNVS